jgi:hypothetical protein
MGQKSNEVAYGFGQMGCMMVDGTDAFFPPKDMVIVAITALTDINFNATNGLVSDFERYTDGANNSPWITTDADAHGTGEIAAQNAHNANGGNATGVITLASADATIKPGMIVEQATMCPRDLVNPYVVKSVDGTTLTVSKKNNVHSPMPVAANLAAGAAAAIYFFASHGQGFGGVEMDASNTIPKGVTIYGRWTAGKLNAAGTLIAYFGV